VTIPIVDVSALVRGLDEARQVADEIGAACSDHGFFYVVGHGVDVALQDRLIAASQDFFALPDERKARIGMRQGGRAWRGWFALGDELTSGLPDQKEGVYFGEELPANDPRVAAGWPLHGRNLFPDEDVPDLRPVVLEGRTAL
jgi:isopenicillin N synthase-like dioxygenase